MEAELAGRTLLSVAAIRELGGNLSVAMETQRALADEVSPRSPPFPLSLRRLLSSTSSPLCSRLL